MTSAVATRSTGRPPRRERYDVARDAWLQSERRRIVDELGLLARRTARLERELEVIDCALEATGGVVGSERVP